MHCFILGLALLFSLESVVISLRSSITLGSYIVYGFTVFLYLVYFFYWKIVSFRYVGLFYWLRLAVLLCAVVLLLFFLFVAFRGYFFEKPDGSEKVVIVLGAGLRGEQVSDTLKKRLDTALAFYNEHKDVTLVVTGGKGENEEIPEALAMKRYLLANGVLEPQIIMEDCSLSTYDNLAFSKILLEQRAIDASEKTVIVTNAFHFPRTLSYAKKQGYSNVTTLVAPLHIAIVPPAYTREMVALLRLLILKY